MEFEEIHITRQPILERAVWVYSPLPNGGFSLRFSPLAWIARLIHGRDATKVFRWPWFSRRTRVELTQD